jgi:hypothetical protein
MAAAKKKAHKVSAPLVQVRLGDRPAQFYFGDILPDGVDGDSLKHLKSLGYVDEVDAPSDSES